MKKHTGKIAIIIALTVTALLLGYAIYVERTDADPVASLSEKLFAEREKSAKRQDAPQSDIDRVLDFPSQDAPEADKRTHYELAVRLAQRSDTLDISGCAGDPPVIEVSTGDSVTITNTDAAMRAAIFGPDRIIEIPPGGSAQLLVDAALFPHETGIYGYGCDRIEGTAGIFYVIF